MTWTSTQAHMLEAMGYEPMQPRPPLWVGPSGPTAAALPAHADRPPGPAAVPPRRIAPASPIDAPPVPRSAGNPAAFAEALRRAAGGRDIDALVEDLERLRRDPALKRALWPRLRALRRLQ